MGALQVWANGMTLENHRNMVAGSYGYIESPGTYGFSWICYINSEGVIDMNDGLGIIAYSYGSPDISFIFGEGFARVVSKSGSIGIGDLLDAGSNADNITLSYGLYERRTRVIQVKFSMFFL